MKKVVGHGDMAQVLKKINADVLFFASGVSNSQENRESEYLREKRLLLKQGKTKRLVYISSLSIFYNKTRYTSHKLEMENLVKENFPKYCIIRLGNISWGKNPHTLINTLKNKVKKQEPIEIQDVYRYIVDQKEVIHWLNMIPNFNCEINIPGTRMKVKEVFKKYV
jgi:hypothetical protein